MANPYTSVTVSNYNLNPPPDDGTEVPENKLNWSKHKEKLADPLKTAIEAVNTNVSAAVGKLTGGVTSTAISYAVVAADQGKTIVVTVAGTTITTPDAAGVGIGAGFKFKVLNLSNGNITIDGSGAQTIDGAATVTLEASRGLDLDTDGSNWFSGGQNWQFDEPDRPVNLFNGSWDVSVLSGVITIALKNDAGDDPSETDSVLVSFRSSTVTADGYSVREITSALSLEVPVGATLGFANSETNLLHIGLLDVLTSGVSTPKIAVSKDGALWNEDRLVSSTAIDTSADSGTVLYSEDAQTNVPCRLLGVVLMPGGATAGTWSNSPTRVTPVTFNPLQPFKNTIKAWVKFNGDGTVAIQDAFNVSSVGDGGAGLWTVNFLTAMARAHYGMSGLHQYASGFEAILSIESSTAPTASALALNAETELGSQIDATIVSAMVSSA